MSPIYIRDSKITVPCNRCGECVKRSAQQWAFRLMQEKKHSIKSYFVTLTYSDENLVYDNEKPILYYRDIQLYIKILRKKCNNLKYYCVGERGDLHERPHWHLAIFNADELDIIQSWKNKGFVDVRELEYGRIVYLLKYLNKNEKGDTKVAMSKGIGKDYITDSIKRWHIRDYKYYVQDGKNKISMPRYYKDKIFGKKLIRDLANKNNLLKFADTKDKMDRDYKEIKFIQLKKEHNEKKYIINNKNTKK